MKKLLVPLALASAFVGSAFADIAPSPGDHIDGQITGVAAIILYSSIGGEEIAFSKRIGPIAVEGIEKPFMKGRVRVAGGADSDTEIGCVKYYNRGRGAVCKLRETFK